MLESDGPSCHVAAHMLSDHEGRTRSEGQQEETHYPSKFQKTGNISHNTQSTIDKSRIRISFDGGLPEYDSSPRSPVMTEHDHGLGVSGLRRIRQQPPIRAQSHSRKETTTQKSSLTLELPSCQSAYANNPPSGASSPTLNFTEDLYRFPSESLHSFSFARQSEELAQTRQNVLKRSLEFLSQKLGWRSTNIGIANALSHAGADKQIHGMAELLSRAQLLGVNSISRSGQPYLIGPLTGPPAAPEQTNNVFDESFVGELGCAPLCSESPKDKSRVEASETDLTAKTTGKIPLEEELVVTSPHDSGSSSRTPTNDSLATSHAPPPATRRPSFRRTCTDTSRLSLQNKLLDALAQPYIANDRLSEQILPTIPPVFQGAAGLAVFGSAVHGHSSRCAPATQAIFTTESDPPFTILAANDLACLVFGVTKAEVRKMGILEVVQKEKRAWLTQKLASWEQEPVSDDHKHPKATKSERQDRENPSLGFLSGRSGVTAKLLSKPNSRQRRSQNCPSSSASPTASSFDDKTKTLGNNLPSNSSSKSRGVLLCGDVIPILKRNGATGSASLWVKEKRGGLIWVLEEIHKDVALIRLDTQAKVSSIEGAYDSIWGENAAQVGIDVGRLLPCIPRKVPHGRGPIDGEEVTRQKYFTALNSNQMHIPCVVESIHGSTNLRISSFPHIAGILVLSAQTLKITSSNSVFSAALFGRENPDGRHITDIIPDFERLMKILVDEDRIHFADGIVIPEYSFRRAQAFLAFRNNLPGAAKYFSKPEGLLAKHRDGSDIIIDVQLRVVKSDRKVSAPVNELANIERDEGVMKPIVSTKLVYALWITYSRHIYVPGSGINFKSPSIPDTKTSHRKQPSPGQTEVINPIEMEHEGEIGKEQHIASKYTLHSQMTMSKAITKISKCDAVVSQAGKAETVTTAGLGQVHKKSINDFIILEEMGQGAYGQVKLARYKKIGNRKTVLKYVTKRRILIDTWTRDRRLGTVPLEIHVLDYLRRDGLQHPNIIEMIDFFEDDVNYYIETVPHGLPGMDLFDYIELRANMGETECKSIFVQVAQAIFHLHTKAHIVHRDIKDENVVLDGEGNIKLIDFGSAAYIKNGPFDVFVGTIDYAAPEVLAGKPYCGKEQDVWALGILLYTIVYKENPFYSIDEIMDHDLRVPYVMNENNLDLIRAMLNRNVESRATIEEVLDHPWCKVCDESRFNV